MEHTEGRDRKWRSLLGWEIAGVEYLSVAGAQGSSLWPGGCACGMGVNHMRDSWSVFCLA